MRFYLIGLTSVALAMQLSACKTPAVTGSSGSARTGSRDSEPTDSASASKPTGKAQGIISVIVNAVGYDLSATWTISSVTVSPGRFKHNFAGAMPNYLHAYFTDDAGNKLDSNLFENPLNARVEAPTEKGAFVSAIDMQTSGTAYLRANNNPNITTLYIFSPDNRKLASFNLTQYLKK